MATTTTTTTTTHQFTDLKDIINRGGCYCLNENPNQPHANLFQGDERLVLRSDTDEQLILHIEFQEAVKLHSINFVAPHDGKWFLYLLIVGRICCVDLLKHHCHYTFILIRFAPKSCKVVCE